jgi:hypothetical protein
MEKQMKSNIPSVSINRPQPPRNLSWQYYFAAIVCCAILVAGFLLAARQHFSSMEYGLQNSKLRRQLDDLQAEKRRLLLSREIAVSPAELRKAVRRIGFIDGLTGDLDVAKPQNQPVTKSVVKAVDLTKPSAERPVNRVLKTVISRPSNRLPSPEKQARKESSGQKRDRT